MADQITMIRGYNIPRGDKMDYAGYRGFGAFRGPQYPVNIGMGGYGDVVPQQSIAAVAAQQAAAQQAQQRAAQQTAAQAAAQAQQQRAAAQATATAQWAAAQQAAAAAQAQQAAQAQATASRIANESRTMAGAQLARIKQLWSYYVQDAQLCAQHGISLQQFQQMCPSLNCPGYTLLQYFVGEPSQPQNAYCWVPSSVASQDPAAVAAQNLPAINFHGFGDFYRGPVDAPAPNVFAPIPPLDGYFGHFGAGLVARPMVAAPVAPASPAPTLVARTINVPAINFTAPSAPVPVMLNVPKVSFTAPSTPVPAVSVPLVVVTTPNSSGGSVSPTNGSGHVDPDPLCGACSASNTYQPGDCCYGVTYPVVAAGGPGAVTPGTPVPIAIALPLPAPPNTFAAALGLGVAGFFVGGPVGAAVGLAVGFFSSPPPPAPVLAPAAAVAGYGSYNSKQFPNSRVGRPVAGFRSYSFITKHGAKLF